jgi:hypothetical protein
MSSLSDNHGSARKRGLASSFSQATCRIFCAASAQKKLRVQWEVEPLQWVYRPCIARYRGAITQTGEDWHCGYWKLA